MVETFTIYPTNKYNRPHPPSRVYLHGLDLSPPIQIHNHRFYQPPTIAFSDVANHLKTTLAEALELYPPVAGTVLTDKDGQAYIAIDSEHRVETPFLVNTRDTPFTGDSEDLSPRTETLLPPASSILAVKVTQFSCGTIAVASSMNHQVTDLRGCLDFLELWAQLARRETVDMKRIPNDWSRTPGRFFPGQITDSTGTFPFPPPFTVLPAPATGPHAYLTVPSKVTNWRITKSSLERLKRDFSPSTSSDQPNGNQWISSGDALATLVSGTITRARNMSNVPRIEGRSSLESEVEEIAMAADGRGRSPLGNMTDGQYFGNFNTLWSTTISRADLSSPTCESASRVAVAIRNALKIQLSPKAIAHKIAFFEAPENIHPPGRISWSADIILTNWCQFDLEGPKQDLGWGKPFRATSGGGSIFPPGYSIMMQNKETGDVSILMTVEAQGLDCLKSDPLLNKYATIIPGE